MTRAEAPARQAHAGAGRAGVHQVGPVGGHAPRPVPARPLRRPGAPAYAGACLSKDLCWGRISPTQPRGLRLMVCGQAVMRREPPARPVRCPGAPAHAGMCCSRQCGECALWWCSHETLCSDLCGAGRACTCWPWLARVLADNNLQMAEDQHLHVSCGGVAVSRPAGPCGVRCCVVTSEPARDFGCRTQAPAHSLAYTKTAVERAFGATTDELFDDFPAAPVASGSIGQVMPAPGRSSGREGCTHTRAD